MALYAHRAQADNGDNAATTTFASMKTVHMDKMERAQACIIINQEYVNQLKNIRPAGPIGT